MDSMKWEENQAGPSQPADEHEVAYPDDAEIDDYLVDKEGDKDEPEGTYASAEVVMQPGVEIAESYGIDPLVSAVHPCGIYCAAATRNMRWVFTGGEDGFIRKWDFAQSLAGTATLTQNQRHGLVDSIQKAGVLVSAWENEVQPGPGDPPPPEDPALVVPPAVSPVYSIDVHSEAVWCVTGLENGNINLWSVRHDEGHCQHVLRAHSSAVSVLKIAPGERSLISGSWDKRLLHWDLDTGSIIREYQGPGSQITSACFSPSAIALGGSDPADTAAGDSVLMATSFDGSIFLYDLRDPAGNVRKIDAKSCKSPPWAISACWSIDGKRIYCGRRDNNVDEIDFAEGLVLRKLKLPNNSQFVTNVSVMPNDRHLLCGSIDNIRMWDLTKSGETKRIEKERDRESSSIRPALPIKPAVKTDETAVKSEPMDEDGEPVVRWEDEGDGDGVVDEMEVEGAGSAEGSDNRDAGAGDGERAGEKEKTGPQKKEEPDEPPEVPFGIIPGHHGGVISHLLIDPSKHYMISSSGTRGWEGTSTNMCLFYEIKAVVAP
ncbi:Transcription factor spt8 [Rhizophlyctis rosea]|uniref:Transcription factor spt8 n=1 Tax=Rhizophlyctis rosea TaxID=64517 RepID=A0AAD5SP83_9FUNG|nr:Transcription factor spt8 [Rhizophlyctis rosea]